MTGGKGIKRRAAVRMTSSSMIQREERRAAHPTDNKYPAGRHATRHKPTPSLVQKKKKKKSISTRCLTSVALRIRDCGMREAAHSRTRCEDTHSHVCAGINTHQTPRRLNLDVDGLRPMELK